MRPLKSMVGEMIMARIPALNRDELSLVKLHGIEANGLWIESQDFTDAMMAKCKLSSSVTTPLLFVPFTSIEFVLGSLRSLSLSETAFGLSEQGGQPG